MANGNNHAKKILIKEARSNAAKLQNGSAGDMALIGRTVGQLTAITTDMYENDFRTVGDCEKMHKKSNSKPMEFRVGPFAFKGQVTPAILMTIPPTVCCVMCVFMLGEKLKWW